MNDEELAALPYADLWLAELGRPVPGYRRPPPVERRPDLPPDRPRHAVRDGSGRWAPARPRA